MGLMGINQAGFVSQKSLNAAEKNKNVSFTKACCCPCDTFESSSKNSDCKDRNSDGYWKSRFRDVAQRYLLEKKRSNDIAQRYFTSLFLLASILEKREKQNNNTIIILDA